MPRLRHNSYKSGSIGKVVYLTEISRKLNLSIPIKLETARDAYATILKRGGKSKDQIAEMLGHSNLVVTEHYFKKTDRINAVIIFNELHKLIVNMSLR
jgi:site-specific recombinase XerD